MLNKIKRYFNKSDGEHSSEQKKTIYNLQQLQREHCFVEVRFPALGEQYYQSLILDVDPQVNRLTIDELYPKGLVSEIKDGELVHVTSRGQRLRLSFSSRVVQTIQHDDTIAYELELPHIVQSKQQRNFFRINIPHDLGIKLYINLDAAPANTGVDIMCSVLNLSATGIGFSIADNYTQQLDKLRRLQYCILELPGGDIIDCGVDIRSVEFKNRPTQRTIVGSRFFDINAQGQKKLDQYIASLQRLQRQHETRMR